MGESGEIDGRGDDDEGEGEEEEVHEADDDEGEEISVGGEIGLAFGDHPKGEGEIKEPGEAEEEEEPLVWGGPDESGGGFGEIEEATGEEIEDDDGEAINGVEVGGEGDPEVVGIGDDVAATGGPHLAIFVDFSAADPDPDGVGEFVTEDIEVNEWGSTGGIHSADEGDQPEEGAEGEEPKLFFEPEILVEGGVGEDAEEGLAEDPENGEEEETVDGVEGALTEAAFLPATESIGEAFGRWVRRFGGRAEEPGWFGWTTGRGVERIFLGAHAGHGGGADGREAGVRRGPYSRQFRWRL